MLKDKTLRQIARKVGSKRVDLGLELDLDWADVDKLQGEHSDPVDYAFRMLLVATTHFMPIFMSSHLSFTFYYYVITQRLHYLTISKPCN